MFLTIYIKSSIFIKYFVKKDKLNFNFIDFLKWYFNFTEKDYEKQLNHGNETRMIMAALMMMANKDFLPFSLFPFHVFTLVASRCLDTDTFLTSPAASTPHIYSWR